MTCQMCRGKLMESGEKVDHEIRLTGPDGKEEVIRACNICAGSVREFILEFREDVKTNFRDQEEAWTLDNKLYLQRRLPYD